MGLWVQDVGVFKFGRLGLLAFRSLGIVGILEVRGLIPGCSVAGGGGGGGGVRGFAGFGFRRV